MSLSTQITVYVYGIRMPGVINWYAYYHYECITHEAARQISVFIL